MTPETIAATLAAMREQAPLVLNVTNDVAMNFSANVLIAAGASPLMSFAAEETGELGAMSGATVVNMGTLTRPWIEGAHAAIEGAVNAGRPWLLDPVGIGATGFRRETGAALMARKPTILRGNASEIIALFGEVSDGKGVDSTASVEAAREAAVALAEERGCITVVTGAVDLVTDGTRTFSLAGGDPLLARITASGCALTGLMGAFAATTEDPLLAAAGALAAYGAAAEIAAEQAGGPGSFMTSLIDALASLVPSAVEARARLLD